MLKLPQVAHLRFARAMHRSQSIRAILPATVSDVANDSYSFLQSVFRHKSVAVNSEPWLRYSMRYQSINHNTSSLHLVWLVITYAVISSVNTIEYSVPSVL